MDGHCNDFYEMYTSSLLVDRLTFTQLTTKMANTKKKIKKTVCAM